MAKYNIPDEVVEMLAERRVIPFIGAGFSASLKLPNWDKLLSKVAEDITCEYTYHEVKKFCDNDLLQVAEYYFLKSDKNIGPIRHVISNSLKYEKGPILSGAHVELVNLGAKQIYTTNYDDLIEQTFKALGMPAEVIALPKHVATSDGKNTQIIKYHGDLKFENTLVLTESSYYSRLDFESPMDLKFRSDLLGKSVLFMGYSFRDVNIRVIWFKLMKMMSDVPHEDRPKSYIVRFDHNPVLEKLYEAVGIKTIVLNPKGEKLSEEKMTQVFADFLLELTNYVKLTNKIPGTDRPMFFSMSTYRRLKTYIDNTRKRSMYIYMVDEIVKSAAKRDIPEPMKEYVDEILNQVALIRGGNIYTEVTPMAITYASKFGASSGVSSIICRAISYDEAREQIFKSGIDWGILLGAPISKELALEILENIRDELNDGPFDRFEPYDGFAYCIDIVYRIKEGWIIDPNVDVQKHAQELYREIAQRFDNAESYVAHQNQAPDVGEIIIQLREVTAAIKESAVADDDDIPF